MSKVANMTHRSHILGLGYYVPPKVLSNADLEQMVDTNDEWITTRTGIQERRIADTETTTSDLALAAARNALADAGLAPEDLTHILLPTLTPDYVCPSAACMLAEKLGLRGLTAMDVNAACSGFLYSLQTARAFTALDPEAVVLAVPAEVLSSRVNWKDRATCVLFGDGAGAAVIGGAVRGPGKAEILDLQLASDGSLAELLTIRGGGSKRRYELGDEVRSDFFVEMTGQEVFKNAVRNMESISRKVLDDNNLAVDDVDVFIPHQANLRIVEAVGKKLGLPRKKVFVNVNRYGNTSAAAVPIALAEAYETGVVKPGQTVLITSFGAGFTWGCGLLRFAKA